MEKHSACWMFRLVALSASALVPLHGATAQERIVQDNKESGRQSYQDLIAKVPAACVENVQAEATKACPSTCMIAVPNEALAEADSCDPRTWTCTWPEQAINETLACPAGWTGTYTQDRYVYVKDCGASFEDTGRIDILSSSCVRERPDTKNEPCPDLYGGGWVGTPRTTSGFDSAPGMRAGILGTATRVPAGVTSARTIYESYDVTTGAITQTGTSDWVVTGVGCARDVIRRVYSSCLSLVTPSCETYQLSNGTMISDGCGGSMLPGERSSWSITYNQILNNQFAVEQLGGEWGSGVAMEETCPTPPQPDCVPDPNSGFCNIIFDPTNSTMNGSVGGEGGGGGGDGGCPFVIDLDDNGIGITAFEDSHATFAFAADVDPFAPREKTAWYAPTDGILARDYDGNGRIEDTREVFGGTKLDGFDELATIEDTTKDGVINAKDAGWKGLRIWRDLDANGIGEGKELTSLEENGIIEIPLLSVRSNITYKDAYIGREGSVLMKDGSKKKSASVFFTNASQKKPKEPVKK